MSNDTPSPAPTDDDAQDAKRYRQMLITSKADFQEMVRLAGMSHRYGGMSIGESLDLAMSKGRASTPAEPPKRQTYVNDGNRPGAMCRNCNKSLGTHENQMFCPAAPGERVAQPPAAEVAVPPQEVRSYRRDDDPDYFAVLQAHYRSPTVPRGQYGHFFSVARDEPLANEFRAYMHQLPSMCMHSMPLGSDRKHAEMVVHALNAAYAFGLERGAPNPPCGRPLVGRMGHKNRDEESMP